MPEVVEVSRHQFSIAYTGDERGADHSISVEALAPALLAFGKLLREANSELNGPKAKANVYVVSDFEHKCFNINFDLALGFYEQVKSLVQTTEIKDAKEILEWIGILSAPVVIPLSFLGYLRWKKGRKTTQVVQLTDKSQLGNVVVSVEGDGNSVTINQNVYNLSQNANALKATRDAFLPIGQDGFDKVEVRQGESVVATIEPSEVEDIVASCTTALAETKEKKPEVDTTTAWLSVYSPVYDEKAENWRFRLGTEVIYADISETSISHDALERGGALTDDTYQVRLEITVGVDEKGNRTKPHYRVLEVIKFFPASPRMRQQSLLPTPPVESGNDEPSA
ncbi:hypothetical protein [Parvibaculum sp.]|uniref:hypothetical protein n=1 Tax=Parvibaculum sp. TaxID=2024848 RepID=UPI001D6792F6|nr:hypothetical protein [Parvibaculum sp.]MBX3488868.1 hypothetical protein [Parvibaculum sp.]MBX3489985.1 hypothetical protein [Parvibaculum sp.]MCW5726027.1 hypothetical protein [Parvibaculum sp.]